MRQHIHRVLTTDETTLEHLLFTHLHDFQVESLAGPPKTLMRRFVVSDKYPFLSPEWIEAARNLRKEVMEKTGKIEFELKMNQIVTDIPFHEQELRTYSDTSQGFLDLEIGEIESPDVTVTIDYETAKALFVDQNPQAAVEAFMSGKIKVTGDLTKLLALQGNVFSFESSEGIPTLIKSITL